MMCAQETGKFSHPLHESEFTAVEIQELLSLFQVEEQSGSQGSNRTSSSVGDYEKKRRRMMSNRDSARRSRLRKKMYLERLTEKAKGLEIKNRSMKNKVGFVMNKCGLLWKENNRLRSEYVALSARLSDLYSIYVAMQDH